MTTPRLHLASASPRRHDILASLGLSFTAAGVEVDESPLGNERPADMVVRLARDKALAAAVRPGTVVVGADTAVVLEGRVYGKPAGLEDCQSTLQHLAGRSHLVMTGVAVRLNDDIATALSVTEVQFREIDPDETLAYWQSGEPCDKAGAYAIQGKGGKFVSRISGSYSGVVGLPVFETAQLLKDAGIDV